MAEVNNALENQHVARTVLDSEYAFTIVVYSTSNVRFPLDRLLRFSKMDWIFFSHQSAKKSP